MYMTVLEWLKASTRYNFEETTFQKIAIDREIEDTSIDVTELSVREKELLTADIIFTALIISPSSTSSQSISHNGFQKTLGTEQITNEKRSFDLELIKSIYLKYNDDKYNLLVGGKPKINFLKIVDEI